MSHFAKIDENNKVIQVIVAEQDFIDSGAVGLASSWIQTSYNSYGGKHYDRNGNEDGKTHLRYNYAGLDFTYDKDNDAFIPPKPYPSFILNETTMRYEPPVPYPTGKDGGPNRFIWDEENTNWKDLWDTSDALSQYNSDSKYYDPTIPQYGDADYPFNDIPYGW